MNKPTDAALVARALTGHKDAFSALVSKHQNYAYGTAIGILADFDLAQDVAQDSFLSAYQNLGHLRDPARFGHWLAGIVRFTAYRALRELERLRGMAEELSLDAGHVDRSARPDETLEADEQRQTIEEALSRLGEKQREVVSLYYLDRQSYSDIATYLGATEATVQGRLQRARIKLRKELGMVERNFKKRKLPEDFSNEIRRLLTEYQLTDYRAHPGQRRQTIEQLTQMGQSAVEPLCAALEDERGKVRQIAALSLCAIGDTRALQPILRLLYSTWQRSSSPLATVLSLTGVREALLDVLRRENGSTENEQRAALQVLAKARGDDEAFNAIHGTFRNSSASPLLRQYALRALCAIRPESAVDFISETIDEADPHLIDCALRTAGPEKLPSLDRCRKAFEDAEHWRARRRAARLLAEHGTEGRKAIQRIVRDGSTEERLTALVVLAEGGSAEAFDQLLAESLGEKQDRGLTDPWNTTYQSLPDKSDFQKLFWKRTDTPNLRTDGFFSGGSPALRATAVRRLSRQRAASFLPELRHCLAGGPARHHKVAKEAFRQLLRLEDLATPVVEEMFTSEDWLERKAAVCLLRRWGKLTTAKREQAASDAHIAVRHAAIIKRPAAARLGSG